MNQPGNWSGAILGFIAVSLAVVTMALLWEAFQEWRRRRAVAEQIKHLSEGALGLEAWPSKYDTPDFSAKGTDVAIETLELQNEGVARVS